jgi:hypothetical protein
MLRNIIREWLSTLQDERALDAPLMAYLGAAGYRDIHLTHGPSEIGKDIIAKKGETADAIQYAIQTKRGDIGTGEWRNPVREQMWEAVRMGINHPGFESGLPRQGVLVLTGQLIGKGQEQIDLFNDELRAEGRRPIDVWNREALISLFDSIDPSTIYPADTVGFLGYGQFFSIYGLALKGDLTPRQIEKHSRSWLMDVYDSKKLIIPAVEATTIANASAKAGNLYVALHAHFALVRVALDAFFASDNDLMDFFKAVANEAIMTAMLSAEEFATAVWTLREETQGKKLSQVVPGVSAFITYPLLCTQLGEALALTYMGSNDVAKQSSALSKLKTLIAMEPGVSKVFSDSQAVSVVAICRALESAGDIVLAQSYLRKVSFEALNLYANRLGMASIEDDEQGEVGRLLGTDFPDIRPPQRYESFMVTAILDLAAFLDDKNLYEDVVNDVAVNRMCPQYYRPLDSRGQFRYDGEDVVRSINVEFEPTLTPGFGFGQHHSDEPRSYRLQSAFGSTGFLILSLLLRDRYFPTTWMDVENKV